MKQDWGGQNILFSALCVNISKTVQDMSKVTVVGCIDAFDCHCG